MKKILIALSFLPALAMAQTDGAYTLKGKIGTLNAPVKVYLAKMDEKGSLTADSSTIVNGNFSFTGNTPEPVLVYLLLDHKGIGYKQIAGGADVLPVYLEKGTIIINSADSAAKAVITGSPINKDHSELMAATKPTLLKFKELSEQARAGTPEQQKSPDFQNKIMAGFQQAQNEYKNLVNTFIKNHPDSYASLLNLKAMAGPSPEGPEIEGQFNALSKRLRESPSGKAFKETLDKAKLNPTAIGAVAPDFSQADVNGKQIKLSSFKGKYVLIDFWASWCGPCRQENPNVVKAYNKYKDKNFTILGVSLDKESGKGAWLDAIKSDGLTWTQVSDLKAWQNEAAVLYSVKGIPQNFLIDPAGKIVAKNLRGDTLEEKLAELLGKI
ncbi:MAG: redoxin domain-containing protein [Chitinophagaceae bacterium]|nr:MAG: redoxin domain-containing protein [Chitinophagaceae bacterium]